MQDTALYQYLLGLRSPWTVCQDRSWLSTNHRSEMSAFHR